MNFNTIIIITLLIIILNLNHTIYAIKLCLTEVNE